MKVSNLYDYADDDHNNDDDYSHIFMDKSSQVIFKTQIHVKAEKRRKKKVFLVAGVLTILVTSMISILYINQNKILNNSNRTNDSCILIASNAISSYNNILALLLCMIYTIIHKRRVFLVKKFKHRNIGIPFFISCWKKSDRFYISFIYGLIASKLFTVMMDSISEDNKIIDTEAVNDPTGLLPYLIEIIQMYMIGISK